LGKSKKVVFHHPRVFGVEPGKKGTVLRGVRSIRPSRVGDKGRKKTKGEKKKRKKKTSIDLEAQAKGTRKNPELKKKYVKKEWSVLKNLVTRTKTQKVNNQ